MKQPVKHASMRGEETSPQSHSADACAGNSAVSRLGHWRKACSRASRHFTFCEWDVVACDLGARLCACVMAEHSGTMRCAARSHNDQRAETHTTTPQRGHVYACMRSGVTKCGVSPHMRADVLCLGLTDISAGVCDYVCVCVWMDADYAQHELRGGVRRVMCREVLM